LNLHLGQLLADLSFPSSISPEEEAAPTSAYIAAVEGELSTDQWL
jgi:hypothetical protein